MSLKSYAGPIIATGMVVAVGLPAAVLMQRPEPAPAVVTTIASPAIPPSANAALGIPSTAAPTTPTPPARPAAPPPMNDGQVARVFSSLEGEALVAMLWEWKQLSNPDVTFERLARNAERYRGQKVIFTGEVLEIQDVPEHGAAFIRLGIGEGDDTLAVFALAAPADDIVRGRRVRVYGMVGGTFSYRSQAGWEITLPRINAVAVVRTSVPNRAPRF